MSPISIKDVVDPAGFGLIPLCADAGFDHRSCDYWEDADRGSKAARSAWLAGPPPAPPKPRTGNPFLDDADEPGATFNPFATRGSAPAANPFASDADPLADNPFAPPPPDRPTIAADAPRKLGLLGRGLAVFGSYAKVLLVDGVPSAYAQFGPLSAYPRAMRLRELYPQLPEAPPPAVITCIATTAEARGRGLALQLVDAVVADLAGRGFAAVEAYPERNVDPDATSAATPEFWVRAGFSIAVDDPRYPVVRRDL